MVGQRSVSGVGSVAAGGKTGPRLRSLGSGSGRTLSGRAKSGGSAAGLDLSWGSGVRAPSCAAPVELRLFKVCSCPTTVA